MAGISKAEREELAAVKAKFESVDLNGNAEAADAIRKGFQKLAVDVHRLVPAGRNKSIAMTCLEDASMRAIRGLAHDVAQPVDETEDVTEPVAGESKAETATEKAGAAPKARRQPRKRTAPKEVVEASA